jgi:hypothetical protein
MVRSKETISRLILTRGPWDSIDDKFADEIPFDSPHESADLLRRLVQSGQSLAYHILNDGERIGLLVARFESGDLGREMVCQAIKIDNPNPEKPLALDWSSACESIARAEGCYSLRFHTCRPQMAIIAANQGYRASEIVMRKEIK